jgi:hypothetical protein
MQEELPALVLSPEAIKQSAMNETPTNPEGQKAGNPSSDEQLMLPSEGAAEAFAELFARCKQPVFGFFRRRVANPGLQVEREIARVRGESEQMEAEQSTLEHRVDFATVNLQVTEEYKARLVSPTPSVSTRIHNVLVAGYQKAAETILGFALFL